jgi:fructose-bisphosphate aldolase class II
MWKINIATQLNKHFTASVRTVLDDHPSLVDPRRYLGAGRQAMSAEVARLIRVLEG